MSPAALAAALALCTARPAAADGPTPVNVRVGESMKLCKANLVHCPASGFICDDPKVAIIENGPEGAELKGVSPGTTLCSLLGYERAFRLVLRVTVKPGR
jgi:hypothetical protein